MSISNVVGIIFKQNLVVCNIKMLHTLYSAFICVNNYDKNITKFLVIKHLSNGKLGNTKCITNNFLMFYFVFKTADILYYNYHTCVNHKYSINTSNMFSYGNLSSIYLIDVYSKLSLVIKYGVSTFLKNNLNTQCNVNIKNKNINSPKMLSSSVYKYIDVINFGEVEFQFLRKNKVYNKGRYSRCRQNYRTGVYLCMYLSVVCIFGLYYWFFKFSFNFSYLWWFFIAFVGSFILPKIIKYRLYEPQTLLNKCFDFFRWVSVLVKSIL